MLTHHFDGESLTLDQLIKILENRDQIELTAGSIDRIRQSRAVIEKIIKEKKTIYGVNTGFGKFSKITIPENIIDELQKNLVMSHATGVGEPLSEKIVQAIILLKINPLAKGFSGVKLEVVQTMIDIYVSR
jgi:histidine ammonia-lyase